MKKQTIKLSVTPNISDLYKKFNKLNFAYSQNLTFASLAYLKTINLNKQWPCYKKDILKKKILDNNLYLRNRQHLAPLVSGVVAPKQLVTSFTHIPCSLRSKTKGYLREGENKSNYVVVKIGAPKQEKESQILKNFQRSLVLINSSNPFTINLKKNTQLISPFHTKLKFIQFFLNQAFFFLIKKPSIKQLWVLQCKQKTLRQKTLRQKTLRQKTFVSLDNVGVARGPNPKQVSKDKPLLATLVRNKPKVGGTGIQKDKKKQKNKQFPILYFPFLTKFSAKLKIKNSACLLQNNIIKKAKPSFKKLNQLFIANHNKKLKSIKSKKKKFITIHLTYLVLIKKKKNFKRTIMSFCPLLVSHLLFKLATLEAFFFKPQIFVTLANLKGTPKSFDFWAKKSKVYKKINKLLIPLLNQKSYLTLDPSLVNLEVLLGERAPSKQQEGEPYSNPTAKGVRSIKNTMAGKKLINKIENPYSLKYKNIETGLKFYCFKNQNSGPLFQAWAINEQKKNLFVAKQKEGRKLDKIQLKNSKLKQNLNLSSMFFLYLTQTSTILSQLEFYKKQLNLIKPINNKKWFLKTFGSNKNYLKIPKAVGVGTSKKLKSSFLKKKNTIIKSESIYKIAFEKKNQSDFKKIFNMPHRKTFICYWLLPFLGFLSLVPYSKNNINLIDFVTLEGKAFESKSNSLRSYFNVTKKLPAMPLAQSFLQNFSQSKLLSFSTMGQIHAKALLNVEFKPLLTKNLTNFEYSNLFLNQNGQFYETSNKGIKLILNTMEKTSKENYINELCFFYSKQLSKVLGKAYKTFETTKTFVPLQKMVVLGHASHAYPSLIYNIANPTITRKITPTFNGLGAPCYATPSPSFEWYFYNFKPYLSYKLNSFYGLGAPTTSPYFEHLKDIKEKFAANTNLSKQNFTKKFHGTSLKDLLTRLTNGKAINYGETTVDKLQFFQNQIMALPCPSDPLIAFVVGAPKQTNKKLSVPISKQKKFIDKTYSFVYFGPKKLIPIVQKNKVSRFFLINNVPTLSYQKALLLLENKVKKQLLKKENSFLTISNSNMNLVKIKWGKKSTVELLAKQINGDYQKFKKSHAKYVYFPLTPLGGAFGNKVKAPIPSLVRSKKGPLSITKVRAPQPKKGKGRIPSRLLLTQRVRESNGKDKKESLVPILLEQIINDQKSYSHKTSTLKSLYKSLKKITSFTLLNQVLGSVENTNLNSKTNSSNLNKNVNLPRLSLYKHKHNFTFLTALNFKTTSLKASKHSLPFFQNIGLGHASHVAHKKKVLLNMILKKRPVFYNLQNTLKHKNFSIKMNSFTDKKIKKSLKNVLFSKFIFRNFITLTETQKNILLSLQKNKKFLDDHLGCESLLTSLSPPSKGYDKKENSYIIKPLVVAKQGIEYAMHAPNIILESSMGKDHNKIQKKREQSFFWEASNFSKEAASNKKLLDKTYITWLKKELYPLLCKPISLSPLVYAEQPPFNGNAIKVLLRTDSKGESALTKQYPIKKKGIEKEAVPLKGVLSKEIKTNLKKRGSFVSILNLNSYKSYSKDNYLFSSFFLSNLATNFKMHFDKTNLELLKHFNIKYSKSIKDSQTLKDNKTLKDSQTLKDSKDFTKKEIPKIIKMHYPIIKSSPAFYKGKNQKSFAYSNPKSSAAFSNKNAYLPFLLDQTKYRNLSPNQKKQISVFNKVKNPYLISNLFLNPFPFKIKQSLKKTSTLSYLSLKNTREPYQSTYRLRLYTDSGSMFHKKEPKMEKDRKKALNHTKNSFFADKKFETKLNSIFTLTNKSFVDKIVCINNKLPLLGFSKEKLLAKLNYNTNIKQFKEAKQKQDFSNVAEIVSKDAFSKDTNRGHSFFRSEANPLNIKEEQANFKDKPFLILKNKLKLKTNIIKKIKTIKGVLFVGLSNQPNSNKINNANSQHTDYNFKENLQIKESLPNSTSYIVLNSLSKENITNPYFLRLGASVLRSKGTGTRTGVQKGTRINQALFRNLLSHSFMASPYLNNQTPPLFNNLSNRLKIKYQLFKSLKKDTKFKKNCMLSYGFKTASSKIKLLKVPSTVSFSFKNNLENNYLLKNFTSSPGFYINPINQEKYFSFISPKIGFALPIIKIKVPLKKQNLFLKKQLKRQSLLKKKHSFFSFFSTFNPIFYNKKVNFYNYAENYRLNLYNLTPLNYEIKNKKFIYSLGLKTKKKVKPILLSQAALIKIKSQAHGVGAPNKNQSKLFNFAYNFGFAALPPKGGKKTAKVGKACISLALTGSKQKRMPSTLVLAGGVGAPKTEQRESNLNFFKKIKKSDKIKKNLQKKRRALKQRRETGRLLKRKRFFPRPIWLRLTMYRKFLKLRHNTLSIDSLNRQSLYFDTKLGLLNKDKKNFNILKKIKAEMTQPIISKTKQKSKLLHAKDTLPFFQTLLSRKNSNSVTTLYPSIAYIQKYQIKWNTGAISNRQKTKNNIKTLNMSLYYSIPRDLSFFDFARVGGKGSFGGFALQTARGSGLSQPKKSVASFLLVSFPLESQPLPLNNFFPIIDTPLKEVDGWGPYPNRKNARKEVTKTLFNEKEFYNISKHVLSSFKQGLWKSSWHRANLKAYFKTVEQSFNIMKKSAQNSELNFQSLSFPLASSVTKIKTKMDGNVSDSNPNRSLAYYKLGLPTNFTSNITNQLCLTKLPENTNKLGDSWNFPVSSTLIKHKLEHLFSCAGKSIITTNYNAFEKESNIIKSVPWVRGPYPNILLHTGLLNLSNSSYLSQSLLKWETSLKKALLSQATCTGSLEQIIINMKYNLASSAGVGVSNQNNRKDGSGQKVGVEASKDTKKKKRQIWNNACKKLKKPIIKDFSFLDYYGKAIKPAQLGLEVAWQSHTKQNYNLQGETLLTVNSIRNIDKQKIYWAINKTNMWLYKNINKKKFLWANQKQREEKRSNISKKLLSKAGALAATPIQAKYSLETNQNVKLFLNKRIDQLQNNTTTEINIVNFLKNKLNFATRGPNQFNNRFSLYNQSYNLFLTKQKLKENKINYLGVVDSVSVADNLQGDPGNPKQNGFIIQEASTVANKKELGKVAEKTGNNLALFLFSYNYKNSLGGVETPKTQLDGTKSDVSTWKPFKLKQTLNSLKNDQMLMTVLDYFQPLWGRNTNSFKSAWFEKNGILKEHKIFLRHLKNSLRLVYKPNVVLANGSYNIPTIGSHIYTGNQIPQALGLEEGASQSKTLLLKNKKMKAVFKYGKAINYYYSYTSLYNLQKKTNGFINGKSYMKHRAQAAFIEKRLNSIQYPRKGQTVSNPFLFSGSSATNEINKISHLNILNPFKLQNTPFNYGKAIKDGFIKDKKGHLKIGSFGVVVGAPSSKNSTRMQGQEQNVIYLSFLMCTMIFHLCALFSVTSSAEIRSVIKFIIVFSLKLTYLYMGLTRSIFGYLLSFSKALNIKAIIRENINNRDKLKSRGPLGLGAPSPNLLSQKNPAIVNKKQKSGKSKTKFPFLLPQWQGFNYQNSLEKTSIFLESSFFYSSMQSINIFNSKKTINISSNSLIALPYLSLIPLNNERKAPIKVSAKQVINYTKNVLLKQIWKKYNFNYHRKQNLLVEKKSKKLKLINLLSPRGSYPKRLKREALRNFYLISVAKRKYSNTKLFNTLVKITPFSSPLLSFYKHSLFVDGSIGKGKANNNKNLQNRFLLGYESKSPNNNIGTWQLPLWAKPMFSSYPLDRRGVWDRDSLKTVSLTIGEAYKLNLLKFNSKLKKYATLKNLSVSLKNYSLNSFIHTFISKLNINLNFPTFKSKSRFVIPTIFEVNNATHPKALFKSLAMWEEFIAINFSNTKRVFSTFGGNHKVTNKNLPKTLPFFKKRFKNKINDNKLIKVKIISLKLIKELIKLSFNVSYLCYILFVKSVEIPKTGLKSIYVFLEKPSELVSDWITHLFLIELASDLTTIIPENTDAAIWNSFTKFAKYSSLPARATFLGTILEKRLFSSFETLLELVSQPDSDLILRQKKFSYAWDIWAAQLKKVAEKNNINISLLTNKKDDQAFLLAKLLEDNQKSININNKNVFTPTGFLNQTGKVGAPIPYTPPTLYPLSFLRLRSKGKGLLSIQGVKQRVEKKNKPIKNLIWKRWSANQFMTYKAKDSDLFIQAPPAPKSFQVNFKTIKHYNPIQAPVGNIICQIYSGIFYKKTAKNFLVVGTSSNNSNYDEKSLLIQSLAGETEIKIIRDNANRYNFTLGIKSLRNVFDALALHTPCLFLIEDIHVIGERRPLLVGDDENAIEAISKCGTELHQGHLIDEKNLSIAKLTRHVVMHYKKPFRGDYSNLIPTRLRLFDLFLGHASHARARQIGLTPLSPISLEKDNQTQSFSIDNVYDRVILKASNLQLSQATSGSSVITNFNETTPSLKKKKESRSLAPPSTTPFTVLLLKEQTKFQPKNTVKEVPWIGLPEQSILSNESSKHNYSIRVKIALLAHLAVSNLSVKLNMITDLLVIIDSVRSNRGFVVFATTHTPAILDPALRRPGRLDETIALPFIPKLENRWEIFKSTVIGLKSSPSFFSFSSNKYFFKGIKESGFPFGLTVDLVDYGLFNSSLSNLNLHTFQFQEKLTRFKKNQLNLSLKNHLETLLPTLPLNKVSVDKVGANRLNETFFLDNILEPSRLLTVGVARITQKENTKQPRWSILSPDTQTYNFKRQIESGVGALQTFPTCNPLTKVAKNKISVLPNKPSTLVAIAYSKIGKLLINNKFAFNYNNLSLFSTLHSPLENLNSNKQHNSPYLHLYTKQQNIKQILVSMLTAKVTETFAFSSLSSIPFAPSNACKHANVVTSGVASPVTSIEKASIHPKYYYGQNPWILFSKTEKRDYDGNKPTNKKSKNQIPSFGLWSLQSIDKTWRATSSIIFSYLDKQLMYKKSLVIPKLLQFYNAGIQSSALQDTPSAPASFVLLPAKRYENYKRSFVAMQNQNACYELQAKPQISFVGAGSPYQKVELHQKRILKKKLYSLLAINNSLNQNENNALINNKTEINPQLQTVGTAKLEVSLDKPNPTFNLASEACATLLSAGKFVEKPTSINWYYRNRLLNRHRGYLNNQWCNGQLSEHNVETTFLSDVDWRSNFSSAFIKKGSHIQTNKKELSSFNRNNSTFGVRSKTQNEATTQPQPTKKKIRRSLAYLRASSNLITLNGTIANQVNLNFGEGIKTNNESGGALGTSNSQALFDPLIDYPDFDQHYNPRNRRWILNFGYWSYWYDYQKDYNKEIYSYLIMETFLQTYHFLNSNREILDYLVTKFIKLGLLKEITLIDSLKRF